MVQQMQQCGYPRNVFGGLCRHVPDGGIAATITELTLDVVMRLDPDRVGCRRQIQHGWLQTAFCIGAQRGVQQSSYARIEAVHGRHGCWRCAIGAMSLCTGRPCDEETGNEATAPWQGTRAFDEATQGLGLDHHPEGQPAVAQAKR